MVFLVRVMLGSFLCFQKVNILMFFEFGGPSALLGPICALRHGVMHYCCILLLGGISWRQILVLRRISCSCFVIIFLSFCFNFWMEKQCFLDSSRQSHAEPLWNYLKKFVLDPKRAKLEQNSDFGHVRTYSSLHKLRNIQESKKTRFWYNKNNKTRRQI